MVGRDGMVERWWAEKEWRCDGGQSNSGGPERMAELVRISAVLERKSYVFRATPRTLHGCMYRSANGGGALEGVYRYVCIGNRAYAVCCVHRVRVL